MEKLPPQPFAYQYGVADDYSGANFEKAETQDNYGNLQGEFIYALKFNICLFDTTIFQFTPSIIFFKSSWLLN